MLMGAFIPGLRRTYSVYEYLAAIILVAGLIIFTLADVSVTPTFDTTGLIMIIGSLVFDAFLGNIQEALFVTFPNISQVESKMSAFLIFTCLFFAALLLFTVPILNT